MPETKITANRLSQTVEFDFQEIGLNDGTVSLPSLAFTSDQNTGLYRSNTHQMSVATNGVEAIRFTSGQSVRLIGSNTDTNSVNGTLHIAGTGSTDNHILRFAGNSGAFDSLFYMPASSSDLRIAKTNGTTTTDLFTFSQNAIMTYSSTGGSGLRIYGSAGTHQWDMYLNSTNLRFSDNTLGGSVVFDNTVQFATGTAAAPALSFAAASGDTGLYLSSIGGRTIGIATAGADRLFIASTGVSSQVPVLNIDGSAAAPSISFNNQSNTGFYRAGTSTIGISTGGVFRMFIDGSGNLGLNTTPATRIDVGTTGVSTPANTGTTPATGTGIRIRGDNACLDMGTNSATYLWLQGTNITDQSLHYPISLNPNGAPIYFPDGAASAPSIAWGSQPNTGLYKLGVNYVGIAANGAGILGVYPSGIIPVADNTYVSGNNGNAWSVSGAYIHKAGDGAAASPSYTFMNATGTGISRISGSMYFSIAGSPVCYIDSNSISTYSGSQTLGTASQPWYTLYLRDGSAALPSFAYGSDTGTGLYRSAASTLSVSLGGTNYYNMLTGSFRPAGDLTQDLGSGSARWGSTWSSVVRNTGGVSIQGTNTNDSASAGFVGETINSAVSQTNYPASGTYGDLTSISLTAGDWLVTGQCSVQAISVTGTASRLGLSTTAGNSAPFPVDGSTVSQHSYSSFPTSDSHCVAMARFSLASTTTVYLKYFASYTAGTPSAAGRITAVRIR